MKWTEQYIGWKPIFDSVGIDAIDGLIMTKDGAPKVLTICQGGNSRSVAAGFILKYKYRVDAIAASWECNSPSTLALLMSWADYIIVMREDFQKHVPEYYAHKVRVADVGHDRWQNGLHPELLQLVDRHLQQWFKVPE